MKRLLVSAAAALVVLGLPASAHASPGHATKGHTAKGEDSSAKAGPPRKPLVEAWYLPNPTCDIPIIGCQVPPPGIDPPSVPLYPANTYHVGVAAGEETARTYLTFNLKGVDEGAKVSLDVPLDTTMLDGSNAPDTSAVEACLYTGTLKPLQGSTATAPTPDCEHGTPLTYAATPAPHLTGDLSKVASLLGQGNGIALVPDTAKVQTGDTWQVVLDGPSLTGSDLLGEKYASGPATLTVTPAPASTGHPTAPPTSTPTTKPPATTSKTPKTPKLPSTPPISTPGSSTPDVTSAPPASTPTTTQAPTDAPDSTLASAPVVPQVVRVPKTFRYRIVWFVPLLLLLGLPMAYRSLAVRRR